MQKISDEKQIELTEDKLEESSGCQIPKTFCLSLRTHQKRVASNGFDVILISSPDIRGQSFPSPPPLLEARRGGGDSCEVPRPDNLSFHWKIIIMGRFVTRNPSALHRLSIVSPYV